MDAPDVPDHRRQSEAARLHRRAMRFVEQVRPAEFRRQVGVADAQAETNLRQRQKRRIAQRLRFDRRRRTRPPQQRHRLLRPRPGHLRPHLKILPRVRLAALDALLGIELVLLQRLGQRRRDARGHARFVRAAVQKLHALAHHFVRRANVQPNQPFGGTAERHPQLVDRQPFAQAFDIRPGPNMIVLAQDAVDVTARVQHAYRMKVQPLGLRHRQHGLARGFGDLGGRGVLQGNQRQALPRRQRRHQFVQVAPRNSAAIKYLIGGVVVDLGVPGAARPLALLDLRVKIPDTVHQFRDTPRAAQIRGQLVLRRRSHAGMQQVVQPTPLEVGGAHRLRLVARQQQLHRCEAAKVGGGGQLDQYERLDRRQVLALVDGDAIEIQQLRGNAGCGARIPRVLHRLRGPPSQREFGAIALGETALVDPLQTDHRVGGGGRGRTQRPAAAVAIRAVGHARAGARGEAPGRQRQCVPHHVRVQLVVERHRVLRPRPQRGLERRDVGREALAALGFGSEGNIGAQQLPDQRGKNYDVEFLMA